jgi:hypothetical protein
MIHGVRVEAARSRRDDPPATWNRVHSAPVEVKDPIPSEASGHDQYDPLDQSAISDLDVYFRCASKLLLE